MTQQNLQVKGTVRRYVQVRSLNHLCRESRIKTIGSSSRAKLLLKVIVAVLLTADASDT